MENLNKKVNRLELILNTEDLNPSQLRLLKSMNTITLQLLTAEDEGEYFDLSANLIKLSTELIKQSNYPKEKERAQTAQQALEFAFDFFNENSVSKNIGNVDN